MKPMKLKDKEVLEMFKKLGDFEIIAFDPKEIAEKIETAYDMRTYAHDLLLEVDILLDEVLTELSGIKDDKSRKSKTITKSGEGVAKNTKGRGLGKKV